MSNKAKILHNLCYDCYSRKNLQLCKIIDFQSFTNNPLRILIFHFQPSFSSLFGYFYRLICILSRFVFLTRMCMNLMSSNGLEVLSAFSPFWIRP